jgi:hypothetical protein
MLSDPDFPMSDPNWQALYALRKHLDDLQRTLVQVSIANANPQYAGLTKQINDASANLQTVMNNLAKVDAVIKDVSQVASLVDQVLKLIP